MNSDHPTMGDIAYNQARSNESYLEYLERRLDELEAACVRDREAIEEWSQTMADAINRIADGLGLEE